MDKSHDLALNKPTFSSSSPDTAHFVTDGRRNTFWQGHDYPAHVDIDLTENCALSCVAVDCPKDESYVIFASSDGVSFDRLGQGRNTAEIHVAGEYRIVRVLVTAVAEGACALPEITSVRVYGEPTGSPVIKTREKLTFTSYSEWLSSRKPMTANDALSALVSRTLGEAYADSIRFTVTGGKSDFFELADGSDGTVTIKANCGVSAAAGLGYYLSRFCGIRITEQTGEYKLPAALPEINGIIRKETPHKVRFMFNYCTSGYTTPFFSRDEWQRELDFLMLSGVNCILDTGGYGALWVHFLERLGYTADEAKAYISPYCYEPWWLMGNIEGIGGTVADAWLYDQLDMARERIGYVTAMGGEVCAEVFTGALPSSFARTAAKHLTAHGFGDPVPFMSDQGTWNEGFIRPNVLSPEYAGYHYIASLYYDSLEYMFGRTTHKYCGDVCHEGGRIPDGMTAGGMARAIMDELKTHDTDAVWMMQGWFGNPMPEVIHGLGGDRDSACVLDLTALAQPNYTDETRWGGREYGGTPWVYCDLNNFGGRTGMHGELDKMAEKIKKAADGSHFMCGIGAVPEGSFQNPVVFARLFDLAWDEECTEKWLGRYVRSRYGTENDHAKKAWELLAGSVYKYPSADGTSRSCAITSYPLITDDLLSGKLYRRDYDPADVYAAAKELHLGCKEAADGNKAAYEYDLADVYRQAMTELADGHYRIMAEAVNKRDADAFDEAADRFLSCVRLCERFAAHNPDETMARWLGRIDEWVTDERNGDYSDYDKYMMKLDARAILTAWASRPINFYAERLYAGLIGGYIIPMWEELISRLSSELHSGVELHQGLGADRAFRIGWDFAVREDLPPVEYTDIDALCTEADGMMTVPQTK